MMRRTVLKLIDPSAAWVEFAYFDGDGKLELTLTMTPDYWAELGDPAEITVSIEVGDKLNPEVSDANG